MFKIRIICLGKLKERSFAILEEEYLKRLQPFAKLKLEELKEVPYKSTGEVDRIRSKEAELVLGRIPNDSLVVLLDERGVLRDSRDFADFFGRIAGLGREIVFVIGSGVGAGEALRARANHVLALSPLTFTHNFARVLLEEQIYRAKYGLYLVTR
jgi:23S rRNA (pseudouridine1915-N3)-methyltransferase